jgi:glycosyltransferase involved in cell wall biosynthesis
MKVMYFHQHFSTPCGSTGTRSYEMAKQLILSGHEVIMVCGSYDGANTGLSSAFLNGQRSGKVDGINVIEFALNYSNNQNFYQRTLAFIKYAYRSIKVALTEQYDVVFATTTPLTAALPGIFARWLRGKHFVFEVRDLWPELPKAMGVINNPVILGLLSFLEWLAYKSAHGHIGLSPGIVKGIQRHLGKDKSVALIPNGCDLAIFAQHDSVHTSIWPSNTINQQDFVAIFTGTHGLANGLENIIKVAALLKAQTRSTIKIVLIGQGKLKKSLQKQAAEQQLSNVIFLDPVNKEKLAQFMHSADVGLQLLANVPAFYYGTSPNKFFDYIAAGLPVVNNYPGWLADLISSHHCGLAVEPDNHQALADALIYLQDNKDILPTLSKNAHSLALAEFDRQVLANKFVNYLEVSYQNHD